jgi:hypothetical protein
VNPTFWKLHGWVDDTIVKWLDANGYRTIADQCNDSGCYQWKSTWVGPEPDMQGSMKDMEKTMQMPGGEDNVDNPDLDAVMKKITAKSGFGNPKFQHAETMKEQAKKMGGKRDETTQEDPLADPEAYLNQYGPCAKE